MAMTQEELDEIQKELDKIEAQEHADENYEVSDFTQEEVAEVELETAPQPQELEIEQEQDEPEAEAQEEEVPATEEVVEETPEDEEEIPATDTPETTDYINLTDDDERKFKIKYKGEDMDIDAKDIKNLTQIGIDAQNKNYKEAVSAKKKLDSLSITDTDLELLAKLKSGDSSAIKDIVAASNLDLETVRENVFEYEQEDIDSARQAYVPQEQSHFERVGSTLSEESVNQYVDTISTFPELDTYRQKLIDNNDTATFDAFINNVEAGLFSKIAARASFELSKLSDVDRSRITSNTANFTGFINPFLQETIPQTSDQAPVQNDNTSTTTVTDGTPPPNTPASTDNKVSVSKKASYAKPTGQPPVVGNRGKTKAEEIAELTAKYEAMDDDDFNSKVRSGSLQRN